MKEIRSFTLFDGLAGFTDRIYSESERRVSSKVQPIDCALISLKLLFWIFAMDEASAAATVVAMLSPSKRGRPAGGTSRQRPSKYRKSEDDSIELYSNKGR